MTCCPCPPPDAVFIIWTGGVRVPLGAGGGIVGPNVGSREATGGQGCCCGTAMGAEPMGTPTSVPTLPFIPMPLFGDVVELEGENDEEAAGSRWSSVRRRLCAGRPLWLLPPFALVLPRLRPAPSPSSLRSSSLSWSMPLASSSSSSPLRPRLASRSSA